MHVCVIGGGIIGTACAYHLVRQGIQTTLIEAEADLGLKTSFANGGQLSYSYVAPLADPAIFADLPGMLLRRDSALKFKPAFSYAQWRWIFHFLLACRQSVQAQSTAALLSLANLSRQALHAWLAQDDLACNHQANGKIIVYESAKSWRGAQKQFAKQKLLGATQELLSPAEMVALEPAIAPMQSRAQGAVYTPSEEVADCYLLVQAMQEKLQSSPACRILKNTRAQGFRMAGAKATALLSSAGELQADHFVVAAGIQSASLLKPLGYSPIIYPLKGYSLTLQADCHPAVFPKISVTDYARRIVYAPMGQQLRIAAMIDIGASGAHPDPQRIALLRRQVQQFFPAASFTNAQVWAGLRPATPTGRPVIGPCPGKNNIWLNIGHGALGFTLAAGSAQLMTELLTQQKPSMEPKLFQ